MRWLRVLVCCAAAVVCYGGGGEQAEAPGMRYQVFLPLYHIAAMPKLGLSGATAAQTVAIGGNWYYNWSTQGRSTDDVEYVPMIWGAEHMGDVVPRGSRWLLGFNEPDGQSLVSPERAAELWRELERRYPGVKLVSPAPSHLDPAWLVRFRNAYIGKYSAEPRLDALAFHGYFATAEELIALAEQYIAWADAWGVSEVWCTEYAFLPGWSGDAWAWETAEWLGWVARTPRLTRHSPFVGYLKVPDQTWPTSDPRLDPSLFTEQGGLVLTDVGRVYAGR